MKVAFVAILVMSLGCNNNPANHPVEEPAYAGADTNNAKPVASKPDIVADSVITIRFPIGSSSTTVTGTMGGIDKPVSVFIPITIGNQLTVLLTPKT